MKKWYGFFCFFYCCCINGNEFAILSSKFSTQNGHSYFFLEDGSSWKVISFKKRKRSLLEWWHNVELIVPEAYESSPENWHTGASIEICNKIHHLDIDDKNASNAKELKKCSHILINRNTMQILFGKPMKFDQCLLEISDEAYSRGYENGYDTGYRSSYKINYNEIFEKGYEKGLSDQQKNFSNELKKKY